MERKFVMTLCHAITAMHQRPRKAIFALVFANSALAGVTEIMTQEVAMAIMMKQLVNAALAEDQPFK
jgi:hypothetical protein